MHYWVFGGPWTHEEQPSGEAVGADKEFLDAGIARFGAVIGSRTTYEAAEAWGGSTPFGAPVVIVTHRPEEEPPDAGFLFVNGLEEAVARARQEAGGKDVFIMGGADVIRQALAAEYVEELAISIAPVVLGVGKRLFEGFDEPVTLKHGRVLQSPFATHITYRVVRERP